MKRWMRKSVMAVVLVALAAGLVLAGTALAQEEGPQRRGHRGHIPVGRFAEATDLTPQEIADELQAGKTPAEILSENGVDPDAFLAELLADLEARLDEKVAAGDIDQARADEMLANAEESLSEALNTSFDLGRFLGRRAVQRHAVQNVSAELAEATGLSREELLAELQAGKTPAEVLAENGGDPDAFVNELLAGLEARLDEQVANGNLEQARADEMLANAAERLEQFMNSPHNPPERGQGPRPGSGGGPGPGANGGPPVGQGSL